MREIGIIAREEDARALADYLLIQNITTKIDPRPNGWALWVHREDKLTEAKGWLAEFEKDPQDPRFQSAIKTAGEIRKLAQQAEREHKRQTRNLTDRWEGSMYERAPLSFALIILCVIAFILQMFMGETVYEFLAFSLQYRDEDGAVKDMGLELIRNGDYWRVITPIFMHFGPMHLIFNLMGLRFLGEAIETRKGTWRLALIVLVAAIGGNIGQYYHSGGGFGGISGVVFALAGYLWIKGHTDPEDGLALGQQQANWMLAWFLLGIIAPMSVPKDMQHGFPFNMANVAHGVGLLTGVVFGLLRF